MADKNIILHPVINGVEDKSTNLFPETDVNNIHGLDDKIASDIAVERDARINADLELAEDIDSLIFTYNTTFDGLVSNFIDAYNALDKKPMKVRFTGYFNTDALVNVKYIGATRLTVLTEEDMKIYDAVISSSELSTFTWYNLEQNAKYYTKSQTYSKEETNNLLNTKQDKLTFNKIDLKPENNYREWKVMTWGGISEFGRENIWTDGENIYYSNSSYTPSLQYVLNKVTKTWETKRWYGLTSFSGKYVWTDGDNIYYSTGSTQYVLDKSTSTWSGKTWEGISYTTTYGVTYSALDGENIWTDGENIYSSELVNAQIRHLVLNKATSTWTEKTWSGKTYFTGLNIWTIGDDVYFSRANPPSTSTYVLDKSTSTWVEKEITNFQYKNGDSIWTDGENIYYSSSSNQYQLNLLSWEMETISWKNVENLTGNKIWTDGVDIYYSNGLSQYVLNRTNVNIQNQLNKKADVKDVKTLNTLLETKQDLLVSGTNIKTINNTSILGSGNIELGSSNVGFVTLNPEATTVTDEQLAEIRKDICVIQMGLDGATHYFYKDTSYLNGLTTTYYFKMYSSVGVTSSSTDYWYSIRRYTIAINSDKSITKTDGGNAEFRSKEKTVISSDTLTSNKILLGNDDKDVKVSDLSLIKTNRYSDIYNYTISAPNINSVIKFQNDVVVQGEEGERITLYSSRGNSSTYGYRLMKLKQNNSQEITVYGGPSGGTRDIALPSISGTLATLEDITPATTQEVENLFS